MYTTAPNTGRKIPRRKRCEGAVGFESKRKSVVTQSWPAGWFLSSDIFAIFRARVYTLNIYILILSSPISVRIFVQIFSDRIRTECGQIPDTCSNTLEKCVPVSLGNVSFSTQYYFIYRIYRKSFYEINHHFWDSLRKCVGQMSEIFRTEIGQSVDNYRTSPIRPGGAIGGLNAT